MLRFSYPCISDRSHILKLLGWNTSTDWHTQVDLNSTAAQIERRTCEWSLSRPYVSGFLQINIHLTNEPIDNGGLTDYNAN
jgi:hypothetical protein